MIAYAGLPGAIDKPRRRAAKIDPATNPMACPFVVVVDSSEQAPFVFSGIEAEGKDKGRPMQVGTVVKSLDSGDYSIVGLESRVSVERKSVSDWFGSIGSGRDRFEREMQRLSEFDFAAVVIEGGWNELLIDRPNTTQVSGKVASRTIASWSIRYGVHFYPCISRRHAELWTFTLLSMFWRQWEKRQQQLIDSAAVAIGL